MPTRGARGKAPAAAPKIPDEETQPVPVEAKPVKKPTADQEAAAKIVEDIAAKRPVIVKLARIMADLPELQPEGFNDHFKYKFIKDTQVSGAIRPRMARERLMVIPEVLEESMIEVPTRNGKSYLTKLKVRFTIIDGDSGDEISGVGEGYGDDSGDKGANKALTAAMKYWLIKLFQIGGEDNESDTSADERASDRQVGGTAPAREVKVEGKKIEGVARGGMSDAISKAQVQQLGALYKDLSLDPLAFSAIINEALDLGFVIDEEGDATAQLNKVIKSLSGDDAGKLISHMVEEKDARQEEPGGGYPG